MRRQSGFLGWALNTFFDIGCIGDGKNVVNWYHVWVIAADGDANSEVQQLIEGYIQQAEQLRSSNHSLLLASYTMQCVQNNWTTMIL